MQLDTRAESKLIRAHEPLLRAAAERLGLGDDDGLQCARLGMLRSIRKFEHGRGLSFDIYIRRGVWRELRQERDTRRRALARARAVSHQTLVDVPTFDDALYLRGLLDALEAADPRGAEILRAALDGELHADIARQYEVSRARIGQIANAVAWRARREERRHAAALPTKPKSPTLEDRVLDAVRASPGLLTWQYALAGSIGSRVLHVRGALEQLKDRGLVRERGDRWRAVDHTSPAR